MKSDTEFRKTIESFWVFLIYFAITFAAATFGAFFKPGEWYALLLKPALNPPNEVFAPVWLTLYFMMAVSIWLVWRKAPNRIEFSLPRNLYLGQLFLNALWSYLFFGLQNPFLAFIDLVFLWFLLVAMIFSFQRLSIFAAALNIPYLLWLSFAGYLNLSIYIINA